MQPVLSIAYRPEDTNTVYNFDAEKAKQLLEEAGWVDSDGDGIREKDGVKFSFECLFSEGVATYEQQLPFMQQSWADVGIEMKPTAVPFTACSMASDTGNYDMAVYGFNWARRLTATSWRCFGCDFIRRRASTPCATANPEYDSSRSRRTRCSARRRERIAKLSEASNIVQRRASRRLHRVPAEHHGQSQDPAQLLPDGHTSWWSLRTSGRKSSRSDTNRRRDEAPGSDAPRGSCCPAGLAARAAVVPAGTAIVASRPARAAPIAVTTRRSRRLRLRHDACQRRPAREADLPVWGHVGDHHG